jgi:hypothetical protein
LKLSLSDIGTLCSFKSKNYGLNLDFNHKGRNPEVWYEDLNLSTYINKKILKPDKKELNELRNLKIVHIKAGFIIHTPNQAYFLNVKTQYLNKKSKFAS